MRYRDADFGEIVGKTVVSIVERDTETIEFAFTDGSRYLMYHDQDCCESVDVDEIIGSDLAAFVGETILLAETAESDDPPKENELGKDDSWTWTFYKLASMWCNATIRWYGTSNGYYSERVDFVCTQEASK